MGKKQKKNESKKTNEVNVKASNLAAKVALSAKAVTSAKESCAARHPQIGKVKPGFLSHVSPKTCAEFTPLLREEQPAFAGGEMAVPPKVPYFAMKFINHKKSEVFCDELKKLKRKKNGNMRRTHIASSLSSEATAPVAAPADAVPETIQPNFGVFGGTDAKTGNPFAHFEIYEPGTKEEPFHKCFGDGINDILPVRFRDGQSCSSGGFIVTGGGYLEDGSINTKYWVLGLPYKHKSAQVFIPQTMSTRSDDPPVEEPECDWSLIGSFVPGVNDSHENIPIWYGDAQLDVLAGDSGLMIAIAPGKTAPDGIGVWVGLFSCYGYHFQYNNGISCEKTLARCSGCSIKLCNRSETEVVLVIGLGSLGAQLIFCDIFGISMDTGTFSVTSSTYSIENWTSNLPSGYVAIKDVNYCGCHMDCTYYHRDVTDTTARSNGFIGVDYFIVSCSLQVELEAPADPKTTETMSVWGQWPIWGILGYPVSAIQYAEKKLTDDPVETFAYQTVAQEGSGYLFQYGTENNDRLYMQNVYVGSNLAEDKYSQLKATYGNIEIATDMYSANQHVATGMVAVFSFYDNENDIFCKGAGASVTLNSVTPSECVIPMDSLVGTYYHINDDSPTRVQRVNNQLYCVPVEPLKAYFFCIQPNADQTGFTILAALYQSACDYTKVDGLPDGFTETLNFPETPTSDPDDNAGGSNIAFTGNFIGITAWNDGTVINIYALYSNGTTLGAVRYRYQGAPDGTYTPFGAPLQATTGYLIEEPHTAWITCDANAFYLWGVGENGKVYAHFDYQAGESSFSLSSITISTGDIRDFDTIIPIPQKPLWVATNDKWANDLAIGYDSMNSRNIYLITADYQKIPLAWGGNYTPSTDHCDFIEDVDLSRDANGNIVFYCSIERTLYAGLLATDTAPTLSVASLRDGQNNFQCISYSSLAIVISLIDGYSLCSEGDNLDAYSQAFYNVCEMTGCKVCTFVWASPMTYANSEHPLNFYIFSGIDLRFQCLFLEDRFSRAGTSILTVDIMSIGSPSSYPYHITLPSQCLTGALATPLGFSGISPWPIAQSDGTYEILVFGANGHNQVDPIVTTHLGLTSDWQTVYYIGEKENSGALAQRDWTGMGTGTAILWNTTDGSAHDVLIWAAGMPNSTVSAQTVAYFPESGSAVSADFSSDSSFFIRRCIRPIIISAASQSVPVAGILYVGIDSRDTSWAAYVSLGTTTNSDVTCIWETELTDSNITPVNKAAVEVLYNEIGYVCVLIMGGQDSGNNAINKLQVEGFFLGSNSMTNPFSFTVDVPNLASARCSAQVRLSDGRTVVVALGEPNGEDVPVFTIIVSDWSNALYLNSGYVSITEKTLSCRLPVSEYTRSCVLDLSNGDHLICWGPFGGMGPDEPSDYDEEDSSYITWAIVRDDTGEVKWDNGTLDHVMLAHNHVGSNLCSWIGEDGCYYVCVAGGNRGDLGAGYATDAIEVIKLSLVGERKEIVCETAMGQLDDPNSNTFSLTSLITIPLDEGEEHFAKAKKNVGGEDGDLPSISVNTLAGRKGFSYGYYDMYYEGVKARHVKKSGLGGAASRGKIGLQSDNIDPVPAVPDSDEVKTLVIDNGSDMCKAGFLGETSYPNTRYMLVGGGVDPTTGTPLNSWEEIRIALKYPNIYNADIDDDTLALQNLTSLIEIKTQEVTGINIEYEAPPVASVQAAGITCWKCWPPNAKAFAAVYPLSDVTEDGTWPLTFDVCSWVSQFGWNYYRYAAATEDISINVQPNGKLGLSRTSDADSIVWVDFGWFLQNCWYGEEVDCWDWDDWYQSYGGEHNIKPVLKDAGLHCVTISVDQDEAKTVINFQDFLPEILFADNYVLADGTTNIMFEMVRMYMGDIWGQPYCFPLTNDLDETLGSWLCGIYYKNSCVATGAHAFKADLLFARVVTLGKTTTKSTQLIFYFPEIQVTQGASSVLNFEDPQILTLEYKDIFDIRMITKANSFYCLLFYKDNTGVAYFDVWLYNKDTKVWEQHNICNQMFADNKTQIMGLAKWQTDFCDFAFVTTADSPTPNALGYVNIQEPYEYTFKVKYCLAEGMPDELKALLPELQTVRFSTDGIFYPNAPTKSGIWIFQGWTRDKAHNSIWEPQALRSSMCLYGAWAKAEKVISRRRLR